jgi:Cu-processing system ATP-binding protein
VIAFRAVTKLFGGHAAVAALSLEVAAGEAVALIGPNGSGKTTSLKAGAGLIRPTAGEVLLGRPGRPASEPEARRSLSYLPQRVSFPDALTGSEVVDFYRRLRGAPAARAAEVLRFASLNGAGARAVGTYSGGMTQRLGLAVAMLPDAPILLLDEPTAALDPDGLCAFYGLVQRRRQEGKTILFTSHQLGDAERLADRFAVLVDGRLAALLSATEMAVRLSDRGVMRLRLDRRPPDLMSTLRPIAPRAVWAGDELVVPGPTTLRPAVLDRLRAAGLEIRALTVEEGRLDLLYSELVGRVEPGGTGEPGRPVEAQR